MSGEREIRQLQKAKQKAQRSGNVPQEAALCHQLGEILANHGRYEEALEEHRQELHLLEGAGDGIGCAVAHRKIGERLAEMENYEAALKHQRQHLELARSLEDNTEQQRAWATIGRTFMFIADSRAPGEAETELREAERAFRTSLEIVEEKLEGSIPSRELSEMRSRLYLNLGLVYDSLKDAAKCEHFIRKSIFLSEQSCLDEDLFRAHFNLGHIRLRDGDPSGALRCLSRARDCARRLQDPLLQSDASAGAAQVLLSVGDFAAAKRSLRRAKALGDHRQRHSVTSALRYATKVTRLQAALEEAGTTEAALALWEQLGDTFSKHGDFNRAVESYQKQLDLAQMLVRPPEELAVIHVSLATTFGDLKDHSRAVHHYRQELALHRGNALEEARTLLSVALALADAGESPAQLSSCLRSALERAETAADRVLQRRILRQLLAVQRGDGDSAGAAETEARLGALGGRDEEEEEKEEEEDNSEGQEESDLELSESEEEELEGYGKSGVGRRRLSKWERRNERGETPLHRACIEGDLRRVELFLRQGHPVNPRDYCGWTPLHEACNHGHLEVVVALLEAGAALDDAGGPGCDGVTPLHDALACGHFEVAEFLVRRGASLSARTSAGLTPLGTLEDWIRTYGPELDEETWQRCRAAERLLREMAAHSAQGGTRHGDASSPPRSGAAADTPAQLCHDSLFDAELGEPATPQPVEPEQPDTAPLRPGKKRQRAKDGVEEYEAAIRSLGSAKSLLGGTRSHLGGTKSLLGDGTAMACRQPAPQPALIPAEQYLEEEDWLEDDLGASRGSWKRPRREYRDAVMASRDIVRPESVGRVPTPVRHRPRRRRSVQSRLSRMVERIPAGRCRQHRTPERECRTPEAAGIPHPTVSDDEGTPPAVTNPTVTPNATAMPISAATPPAIPTLRVRVRIQDNVFLIPVPQSEDCAVGWLAARAAERYYQALGLLPRVTLKKEGALLAPQDAVRDVLRSNEEVLAEVQGWDLPPLAERYRRACQSLGVEPHPLLLKVTELQEQSPELGFREGLALRPPHLPPLLRALKLQESLRQLRLRGCGLSDTVATDLLATLATLPALTLLDLANNRLGPQGLRNLLPGNPGTDGAFQSLEELDLSLNPLGDAGCRPLAQLLQACPALTALRIQACGFSDAFILPGASRLKTLALSWNTLGTPGLERLLGSVSCRSLIRLELSAVAVPGSRLLTAALGKFLAQEGSVLSHLTLAGNRLGDEDILEVARSLPLCPTLVSLDFSANPGIGTVGLRMLLSALEERNQDLQFLNLAGCSVEGPLDATTWTKSITKIRDLRLCGRHVSRKNQRDASTELGTVTRHRKLFWKSL
ncbi:tonsoku-like protein [Cuculus canorus]|uniref:tonsoku-like protein n=1 Tax=Cuculus canorus TaxID=55661 RepID=UPI0023AAE6AF|nr:tonsoku-like protein [Cuculus canorus]